MTFLQFKKIARWSGSFQSAFRTQGSYKVYDTFNQQQYARKNGHNTNQVN